MRYLTAFVILALLTGCVIKPNYLTGADCWRTGVLESGNTGRMTTTPINDIPVVTLGESKLNTACNYDGENILWGCYNPISDTVYVRRFAGNRTVIHELCHSRLGRKHNSCYQKGYGVGKTESACEWDNI